MEKRHSPDKGRVSGGMAMSGPAPAGGSGKAVGTGAGADVQPAPARIKTSARNSLTLLVGKRTTQVAFSTLSRVRNSPVPVITFLMPRVYIGEKANPSLKYPLASPVSLRMVRRVST